MNRAGHRAVEQMAEATDLLIEPAANPAEARTRERGISLWALIAAYLATRVEDAAAGRPEEATLDVIASSYRISIDTVRAALAYYREHRRTIDTYLEARA